MTVGHYCPASPFSLYLLFSICMYTSSHCLHDSFWKEDDPSTHIAHIRVLTTEKHWPKHNQHPALTSPKPEFTAFLITLTVFTANSPWVPILELAEAGPSTATPLLHVGRCSQPHTCSQTSTAFIQTVPETHSAPALIPVPSVEQLVL